MLEVLVMMLISQQPVLPAAEGFASYYTVASSGSVTASGERLVDSDYTCASNFGDFGDYLLIVADSGKSVVCRINDRGPFAHGRVVDLSKSAMRELDPGLGRGVVRVKVYALGDQPRPSPVH